MRVISALLAGAILSSCTAYGPPYAGPTRSVDKEREYDQLMAGKVPGTPMSCLPHFRSGDMRRIDDNTILFRDGAYRTYVTHMQGGCTGIANGQYTLVTHQFGTEDLCRGDIVRVVDPVAHFTVGSCVWGDFVPYVTPGRG